MYIRVVSMVSLLLFSCNIQYSFEEIHDVVAHDIEVLVVNPKYLADFSLEERPATPEEAAEGATTAINAFATLLRPGDDNATIKLQAEALVAKQYKKSVLNMEMTICKWSQRDKFVWPLIQTHSNIPNTCPLMPNRYYAKDLLLGRVLELSFAPFRKGRLIATVLETDSREVILQLQVHLRIDPRVPAKKRHRSL